MHCYISLAILLTAPITSLAQNVLWARYTQNGANSSTQVRRMDVDADGNVYVLGEFFGPAVFENDTLTGEYGNVFLAKYTLGGDLLWVKEFGEGAIISYGGDIKIDRQGNLIIFCYFLLTTQFYDQSVQGGILAKIDPNGDLIWAVPDMKFGLVTFNLESKPSSSRLAIDDQNNIIVLAAENISGTDAPNYVNLIKFYPSGHKVWTKRIAAYTEYPLRRLS